MRRIAPIAVLIFAVTACTADPAIRKQRYLESGNAYAQEKKWREAVIEYRNALQIDARFGEARLKAAEAYANLGDGASALNEYVRAADLLPDDVDVQLMAGSYLLAAGQLDSALARADAVLAKQPDNVPAHVMRGSSLAGLKDLDSALEAVEEAVRLDPKRGATYTHLGIVELARGKRADAEAAFKRAVSLDPKSMSGYLTLGNFYWAAGRQDDAERAFETALAIEPTHVAANRAMALLSLATGHYARAEKHLKQVAETSPGPAATLALADFYVATNRSKEAIAQLQPLVGESRHVPGAKHRLAAAMAASGDRIGAHALLDGMLASDPRDGQAQLLKGKLLIEDGKTDDALPRIETAVAVAPASAESHYVLGKLYASRGDLPGAERAFSEAIKLNPRAVGAQIALSQLQLATARPRESVASAAAAVQQQPSNLDARVTLVRSWLVAKEYDKAEKELRALLAAHPKDPAVHVLHGALAAARRQIATARDSFERALSLDRRSVDAFAGLVGLDLQARDASAVRKRIEARLAEEIDSSDVLLVAARAYASMNEMSSAEAALRRAVEEYPSSLPAYAMLGQLYLNQSKLDEARKEYDTLAERQARPVGALTMSGVILQAQGNVALARQRYERAVGLDARAAVAANNLAWLYAQAGENLEHAVQLASTASQALPDSAEVLDTLGWVYFKNDQPSLALSPLLRAVQKGPGNPTYHYHLGLVYERTGDIARARQSISRALELKTDFPSAADARRAMTRLSESPSQ